MSAGWLLLNGAYLVYTASALFREMLWLRATLLAASVLYIAYGAYEPVWSVFWWNIPVLILHSYWVWKLLKQRRGITLEEEAEAIHQLLFSDLDRIDFNTMWRCGDQRLIADGEVLITKDQDVDHLYLILDGEVDVAVNDDLIIRLSQFRLLGEMSSLSGSRASATVTANGEVRVRKWEKTALATCGQKNPQIELALVKAMGHEVARKLN